MHSQLYQLALYLPCVFWQDRPRTSSSFEDELPGKSASSNLPDYTQWKLILVYPGLLHSYFVVYCEVKLELVTASARRLSHGTCLSWFFPGCGFSLPFNNEYLWLLMCFCPSCCFMPFIPDKDLVYHLKSLILPTRKCVLCWYIKYLTKIGASRV